ncbi:MAG: branched-chain amino acid ABC transporter permease [Rubrivivax sp.]
MSADLVQLLVATLTTGTLYAMVAVGVTLIYSATGIINFAQGEFYMLAGMTMSATYGSSHWPMPVALALTGLVLVVYAVVLMGASTRLGRGGSLVSVLIISIGTSIATSGVASAIWDADTHRFKPFSGDAPVSVLGATITPQAFWIVGVGTVSIVVVELVLRRTLVGRAMRAAAMDREAVSLMGVPPWQPVMLAFVIAGLLSGVGGVVGTPLTTVDYHSGFLLAIKGFSAAMLGGMGQVSGALAGALLIAGLESVSVLYGSSQLKELSTFAVVLAVILFMPRGLFGGRHEFGMGHAEH